MLYKPNWEKVKEKYIEYWSGENHDRPILSVTAPKNEQIFMTMPSFNSLKERWLDTEYMLRKANLDMANTYYGGDSFPCLSPNLGPDVFSALYGTMIEFGEDTSWAMHNLEDWSEYGAFKLEQRNGYYEKIVEMTKAAIEDGKDRYFVGITDIHPGMDALVSMRGPEQLCIDALECPEVLQKASMELFGGFKTFYSELYDITAKYQPGSSNWMGIWHPKRWYVTSCDFACLISPEMFERLVVDELKAELNFLDASMFHLDGPGALVHLDRLLENKELDGIQWVYGAGQPTASHWIDVLKRIQDAGKIFQINAEPEELPVLLENLKPEGAMYVVRAKSESEAKEIEKIAGFKG